MKNLSLTQQHILMVIGMPTSGKTTFLKKFAESFGAPTVNIAEISTLAKNGKAAHALAVKQLSELAKTRQFIVLEEYGNTAPERQEIKQIMAKHGYKPFVVWVQTDMPTLQHRLNKKLKPITPPYNLSREIEKSIKSFAPPHEAEVDCVISGRHTYATQARIVLKKLSEVRTPASLRKPAAVAAEAPAVHAPRGAAPIKAVRKMTPSRRRLTIS